VNQVSHVHQEYLPGEPGKPRSPGIPGFIRRPLPVIIHPGEPGKPRSAGIQRH